MRKNIDTTGAGGHGQVVREIALSMLTSSGETIYKKIDFLDDNVPNAVGKITDLDKIACQYDKVIVGIGNNQIRKLLQLKVQVLNCSIPVLIHPRAYVSDSAVIKDGSVIEPMAMVNSGAIINRGCIVSIGAIIDHDVVLGEFCHVNAGSICKAGSKIAQESKIDSGEIVKGF